MYYHLPHLTNLQLYLLPLSCLRFLQNFLHLTNLWLHLTRALAYSVSHEVKQAGGDVLGMEGQETGEWVLVDLGPVVCHCLQPNVRDYYNLEEIWGGKEVFLKANEECASRLMPHRPGHMPEDFE